MITTPFVKNTIFPSIQELDKLEHLPVKILDKQEHIHHFVPVLRDVAMGDVEKLVNTFSVPVSLTYTLFGFFHLSAVLTLILQLHFFKRDNILRACILFNSGGSLLPGGP